MSPARLVAALISGALLAGTAAPALAAETEQVTWHGTQIHLYGAQAAGRSGSGVVVAVLDGWIDRSHPDFTGRAMAGADCRSGACKPGLVKENCGSEHGTHVAGTVGSSSYGVAPKATILPIQVLSSDAHGECTGTPAAVASGIDYAVAHGAKVLNLSLGADDPASGNASPIPAAVHRAAQAGAVVVFSAGNKDLPIAQSYGSDALIVAATGPSGALASYSQHGAGVSVAAPGGQPNSANQCTQATCVTSLYPGDGYAVAAGTSMAAPHVAGLAALLFGQAPGRSRDTVIARIRGTATPLAQAGSGLINVRAALGVSGGATAPAPSPTRRTPPKPVVTSAAPKPSPASKPSASAPAASAPPRPSRTAAPPSSSPSFSAPSAPPVVSSSTQAKASNKKDDDVPAPVAGAAILLLVGAGAGTLTLGLGRRRP